MYLDRFNSKASSHSTGAAQGIGLACVEDLSEAELMSISPTVIENRAGSENRDESQGLRGDVIEMELTD